MLKKLLVTVTLAAVALFLMAGLVGCNTPFNLDEYKTTAKAELESYVIVSGYSAENWAVVLGLIEDGKAVIDAATDKAGVDSSVAGAKTQIDAVEKEVEMTFPSVLENFELEDFTEEFFENNTLILVPFQHGYLLYDHLDFYTVYVENGKLNFIAEVTDPNGGGDKALDIRVFAVIIPNDIFSHYEVGELIKFNTYDFSAGNINNPPFELPPQNNRDWLTEVQEKSIEHRVGYIPKNVYKHHIFSTTIITSVDLLSEHFRIPSIDEDFMDDRVIVVLNQKDSRVNGEIRLEDFRINNEIAKLGEITDLSRIDNPEIVRLLENGDFFQILQIDLLVKGKEQVIQAILELQKSEIVYSAEPDYNYVVIYD